MNGKFVTGAAAERDQLDWGVIGWFSRPATTGAKTLVVIEVTLEGGFGHDFHKHPQQEEVIYVMEGEIEQWLEDKKQVLGPGDAVFIPADMVHASFNTGTQTAKLHVTLGPSIGDEGYELVEVHEEEPWRGLRSA